MVVRGLSRLVGVGHCMSISNRYGLFVFCFGSWKFGVKVKHGWDGSRKVLMMKGLKKKNGGLLK